MERRLEYQTQDATRALAESCQAAQSTELCGKGDSRSTQQAKRNTGTSAGLKGVADRRVHIDGWSHPDANESAAYN